MKAEELFIGALVRVNRDGLCIKKGTIVEVRGVDADDKLTEKGLIGAAHCRPLDDDQFEGGIWCEYLEPIPLTPEILKKNGFSPETYDDHILVLNEKSGEVIYYECEQDYGLTIDNQYSQIRELKIQYLHELQHAFRLCGIDKEIEL